MRPDLPKALSRKIIVAQERVLDQRSRIENAEASIEEAQAEIGDFERDPAAYALARYGARHGVDSHPVVTRLSMLREKLDRYVERRPIRVASLHEAECALAAIQEETLQVVLALRPSADRVPWPAALPPFTSHEEATRVDASVLAMAQDINEAEKRGFDLEIARRENEDARAHEGMAEALEEKRRSFSPAVSERRGRIVLANRLAFTVTATSSDGLEILQEAISGDQAGMVVGRTWDLACAILRSGVDWPGWEAYHRHFREACNAGVEHQAGEKETSVDEAKRVEHIQQVCRHHYCPEGVGLPVFVDGPPAKPSKLRTFIEKLGLSKEQAEDWFLKTWPSGRMGTGRPFGYGADTLAAMEHVNLLIRGSAINTSDAIELMSYGGLRAAMAELGLRPGKTKEACRVAIVQTSLSRHGDVERAVGKHRREDGWIAHPPSGMTWTEFHSCKQQIRGMAEAITDLYLGKWMPARDRQDLLS